MDRPSELDTSHFDYKLTDWVAFRNIISNAITLNTNIYSSKPTIDLEIEKFSRTILEARNHCTPRFNIAADTNLPLDIVKLIKIRKSFIRKRQRASIISDSNFYEQCTKLLTIMINNKINTHRNIKWSRMLSKLRPGNKSFWKISRSLRGIKNKKISHFTQGNRKIITDDEKAQLLSVTFSISNSLTSIYKHSIDKIVNSKVNLFKASDIQPEAWLSQR